MFNTKLKQTIEEQKKTIEELNLEIRELKHKKKLEEEDIKHLVKMKEAKLEQDISRRRQDLEGEFKIKQIETDRQKDAAVFKIKEEYATKVEEQLHKRMTEIREMYSEIVARLPDINVTLNKELGNGPAAKSE